MRYLMPAGAELLDAALLVVEDVRVEVVSVVGEDVLLVATPGMH
jgi:hypothetical protein